MWVTLVSQNLFVMLSTIVMSLLFQLHWNVCKNLIMFAGLIPLIMIFGSGGFLATTANLIALEKDWVVVVSNKMLILSQVSCVCICVQDFIVCV